MKKLEVLPYRPVPEQVGALLAKFNKIVSKLPAGCINGSDLVLRLSAKIDNSQFEEWMKSDRKRAKLSDFKSLQQLVLEEAVAELRDNKIKTMRKEDKLMSVLGPVGTTKEAKAEAVVNGLEVSDPTCFASASSSARKGSDPLPSRFGSKITCKFFLDSPLKRYRTYRAQ